mgnify:CR=1 FL=1
MTQSARTQGLSVSISRRSLLKAVRRSVPGIALGSLTLQTACSADAPLTVNPLSDSLSLISGAGSNVLVKRAPGGELLVVDGGLEANAEALLDSIEQSSGSGNITTLMNTHWHREQTGLNRILGETGSRIFAHENTRLWLGVEIERPWEDFTFAPLPESARPGETFYFYGNMDHFGSTVWYGNLVQAHTDGDMYVFFPEENILHAGGVIANDAYPLIDWWTGGWIGGLVNGLETLIGLANADTVIVPANGPVMTYAELLAMREMYNTIFRRVRDLFMNANSPQETLDAAPTAEFDARWGDPDAFVLLAHQSLIPHLAPDA